MTFCLDACPVVARPAAKELGLELRVAEASSPAAIDSALAELAAAGSDALISGGGPLMFDERARIGAFVLAKKLPTFVSVAEMVPYGALLSYGPDFPDDFRRAVGYVDNISRPTFRSSNHPASGSPSTLRL